MTDTADATAPDAADTGRPPVEDWATDFDHTHPDYAAAAPEIWDDLRERCPVAVSYTHLTLPTIYPV